MSSLLDGMVLIYPTIRH